MHLSDRVDFIDAEPALVDQTAPADEAAPRRPLWPRVRPIARRMLPWIAPALVALAYLAFAIHHFAAHRYQINPDGVGYISVAQKYLRGEWADAVNAYWSPLYSWLLMPLLAMGIEPLAATKVLGVGIGGLVLFAMTRLLRLSGVRQDVRTIAALAAIPLVVGAAYDVITPDLLLAAALLLYLGSLCNPAGATRWTGGLRVGLAAGVAYLAKAYALPVVIAHFALVRLAQLIRPGAAGERRGLLIATACTLAAGAVVVGAWSAVLSAKYGGFTTGSTGRYNLRIDAPGSPGQVMHWAGFLPPSNPTAISAWEDITPYVDYMPAWHPLESAENRDQLRKRIDYNYAAAIRLLERYTPWFYPLAAAALLVAMSRADLRPRRPGLILAGAIVLYPCGYLLLHVEARFLVALVLLLLTASAYIIGRLRARGLLSGWWRSGLAMVIVGYTFLSHPLERIDRSRDEGAQVAEWAGRLRGAIPAGSTIASDARWGESLFLAFHLDWRYYGEPRPRQPTPEIQADLDRLNVEYLMIWRRSTWPARAGWTEVQVDAPFRLYRRTPSP